MNTELFRSAPPQADPREPWNAQDFEARLRACEARYHIHHPFNQRLNRGELQPFQVRAWVANRFYYQVKIPQKDAAVLANCPDRAERRRWIERILDHDGRGDFGGVNAGGIEAWSRLGVATGLKREDLWSHRHVRAGVRFAVDAYVNFARRVPWQEAVCSSLTELFAPEIHKQRLATWPEHYGWIEAEGLSYFRNRLSQARRDVEQGLSITLDHFATRPLQERALEVLQFKLDILWAMNDAMALRYGVTT